MNERVRILLVEDNSADVYLFRKALLRAGLVFDLTIIEDGGTALEFAHSEGQFAGVPVPDLAVIDLSLPVNDGLQILEAIRAAKRFADMPVVIASSSASPPSRLTEDHLRVARYITKPPDLEEFLQIGTTLKEVLAQSHARRSGR
jgi:two-component system, chemotaxis family, response regulator Rcp1